MMKTSVNDLDDYFVNLNCNEFNRRVNRLYFEELWIKFQSGSADKVLLRDDKNKANLIAYAIATEEEKKDFPVTHYEELPGPDLGLLKKLSLCVCKMQAGLGSSLERDDLLKKYSNRSTLGSKGTDLFVRYHGVILSLAEVQLLKLLERKNIFHKISYYNLVNEETMTAVKEVWEHKWEGKSFYELLTENKIAVREEVFQGMMPTVNEDGHLSKKRLAPAGHGFLGFHEILALLIGEGEQESIVAIGNGEDLKSTPDNKIFSWVAREEIPIVMITTTKQAKDKKGGQLALEKGETSYIRIVERAQAEAAGQLEYFERLGLRSEDGISLFNTNIVILNKKSLKKRLERLGKISIKELASLIAPDLIKNTKEQDAESFVQLEGAIGSVLLNLDKFFRQEFKTHLIHFLNLSPENREKFFMPLKKRQDFDEIYGVDLG